MINVLHVEDNYWYIDALSMELAEKGIIIQDVANDKSSTIEKLKLNDYDFILVDLNLNGIEWYGIEIIKEIVELTKAYIIVLSGNQLDYKKIRECELAGSDYYIYKGNHLHVDQLIIVIEQMMNNTFVNLINNINNKLLKLNNDDKKLLGYLQNNMSIMEISTIENEHYETTNSRKKRLKTKVGNVKRFITLLNKTGSKI